MARLFILFTLALGLIYPNYATAQQADNTNRQTETTDHYVIQGKITDANTGKALGYATISVQGTNITTVSNNDGEFLLKIPHNIRSPKAEIKYLGYKTEVADVLSWTKGKTKAIQLQPETIRLTASTIRPDDAASVLKQALFRVNKNYSLKPYNATAFYRETVKKNSKYLSLAEAVLDIYKTGYDDRFEKDAAAIYRGRKSSNISPEDSILFKYQGGISTALLLDVVKYFDVICPEDDVSSIYNFAFLDNTVIDGRTHYVIGFDQKPNIIDPMYRGKFYIDTEKLAISRIEFNMNVEGNPRAADIFVLHKPRGTVFTMESVSYLVDFHEHNGTWYYNYSRAEIKFKCKRESKKLFNFATNGTIMSEMAITDRNLDNVTKIPSKRRVRSADILVEKLSDFTDTDFWGDYNVIEPDQTIDSAIRRLKRTLQRREKERDN